MPNDLKDPRPKFLATLLDLLGDKGTILAYNAPFEMGRLRELAELIPKQRKRVEATLARFQDLMTPFAKGWFVHPDFEGSTSIKAVLPALVPAMTYEGMAVGDGSGAIRAYAEFLRPETTAARRQAIRKRSASLSITHKSCPQKVAEFDICQPGEPLPDDLIARCGITGPGEIPTQPGYFHQIGGHDFGSSFPGRLFLL